MRNWLLYVALMGIGCGGRNIAPISNAFNEQERLARFQEILTNAAEELGLPLPEAVIAPEAFHEQDTRAMQVRSRWPLDMVIQVDVRPWFLMVENEVGFRHAALHEMCHVMLFHGTASFFTPQQKEFEAEHCVYRRVDEDDYFALVRRMASRRIDRPDLIALSQADEEVFRAAIRKQLGLPEKKEGSK